MHQKNQNVVCKLKAKTERIIILLNANNTFITVKEELKRLSSVQIRAAMLLS